MEVSWTGSDGSDVGGSLPSTNSEGVGPWRSEKSREMDV